MAKGKGKVNRSQIVVAALALMVAAAGYLSYTGINKLDEQDLTGTVSAENAVADTTDSEDASETAGSQPGEAVLTNSAGFVAQAKVDREQIRSQNKEMLLEIIDNEALSEEERQAAVASMVEMTDLAEKEAAAETMLEAKGFADVVVNLTGTSADVMVPENQLSDTQRAQIEDIIMRKTEISGENIVITPMNHAQDTSEGE